MLGKSHGVVVNFDKIWLSKRKYCSLQWNHNIRTIAEITSQWVIFYIQLYFIWLGLGMNIYACWSNYGRHKQITLSIVGIKVFTTKFDWIILQTFIHFCSTDEHMNERMLVFSPKNEITEKLLHSTARLLEFDRFKDVESPSELEAVMHHRKLCAAKVSTNSKYYRSFIHHSQMYRTKLQRLYFSRHLNWRVAVSDS